MLHLPLYTRLDGAPAPPTCRIRWTDVKGDGIRRLIEVVNNVAGSVNQGLWERFRSDGGRPFGRDPSMMAGKTRQNKTVHWPARPGLEPGQLVNVMISRPEHTPQRSGKLMSKLTPMMRQSSAYGTNAPGP